eukprot:4244995-Pyramimonas_sp.AAC.1
MPAQVPAFHWATRVRFFQRVPDWHISQAYTTQLEWRKRLHNCGARHIIEVPGFSSAAGVL